MREKKKTGTIHAVRLTAVLGVLAGAVAVLIWRVVDLQVVDRSFLQDQGDARHLRAIKMPAHRGMITDRNGEALAMSTPVDSVWVNPQKLVHERDRWGELAAALDMDRSYLAERVMRRADREFVYLRRHINPALGERVRALGIPGVALQREYRRYYPVGEVAAHVVGFTNIDDVGQEGMELAYEDWLSGESGRKWVLKDRLGHVVEDVAGIREPAPGKDLALSIDRRVQYLAYRELKTAVQLHRARSGSAVVLDVLTGEVLAMVNQPSHNPNDRGSMRSRSLRNRAVTDVFEPGSTVKPFTVAAALEADAYRPDSRIDTSPGYFRVGGGTIRDMFNYGAIDVTTVVQKSSNVGASKIALALSAEQMWRMFSGVGFGSLTGSGFPGEASGLLTDYWRWSEFERATLSFGYGVSATPLQLALAYTVLGDQGRLKPVSFVPVDEPPEGQRVMSARTADEVRSIMETVIAEQGTGTLAGVSGYRVAGKTGTVQKVGHQGYSEDKYMSLFAGLAPAGRPRLAMVVVINEPRGEEYYGGRVAAPVFSKVMTGALRILGIMPDSVPADRRHVKAGEDRGGVRLSATAGHGPERESGRGKEVM